MNIFNSVKGLHPKRNKFTADTYRNDFTAPLGVNIPCFWAEVPPATRIKVSASALVRLQALIAPVMDNIDYYVHFWKIPYRLLENDLFTKFISGEIEAADYNALFASPAEIASQFVNYMQDNEILSDDGVLLYETVFGNGGLFDFLGYDRSLFPDIHYDTEQDEYIFDTTGNEVTVLNWRGFIAYFMIHLNWYMNENVPYYQDFQEDLEGLIRHQDSETFVKILVKFATMFLTGDDTTNFISMFPHGWDKDYFTSALPNVQYGDPVTLPFGGSAPVSINKDQLLTIVNPNFSVSGGDIPSPYQTVSDDAILTASAKLLGAYGDSDSGTQGHVEVKEVSGALKRVLSGSADLSEASVITINELRFANALQVFKERQMRFGRRRLEYYKGFFDVEPEDLRLQVPKYLGGGRIPINIADIEQTSATSGSQALGHIAGKATAVAGGFAGFSTFCSEETFIIGISFAMPHITYAQQLSRFKMKTNDIYDYFNPSFEHLGEQAIKNIEIYAGSSNPEGDWGYTPRYTEYRFHSNEMHGEFKDTLAYWSLGRIFDSQPALNAHFVYMQPSAFDRIFAVSNQPNMIVSMLFQTKAIKPVSKYGTPMLLA